MLLYTHCYLSVCRSVVIVDDPFAARMPQLLRLRQECRSSYDAEVRHGISNILNAPNRPKPFLMFV